MKITKLSTIKYITISILVIALSSCKKPETVLDPEPKTNPTSEPTIVHKRTQIPIVVKASGENCTACGSWGWPAWITLSDELAGIAFCWTNYAGSYAPATGFRGQEINAPTSDAAYMLGRFSGVTGYPNFVVNMVSQGTSTATAKSAALTSAANTDVKISAGFLANIEGDVLTINAEAKVYENLTGDYYMGAYVVEDKIVAYQAGTDAGGVNAEHHLVFRGSMSNTTFGEQIIDDSANQDMILNKTFTVTLPSSYNKENLTYGIIIWKKELGAYTYVNAATDQVAD